MTNDEIRMTKPVGNAVEGIPSSFRYSRFRYSLLIGLCCFLSVLSALYLIKGFHSLIVSPADMHRRWVECRFVIHGQDPFQIHLHRMHRPDPAYNQKECDRLSAIFGSPEEPVYPPWAYAPALIFMWPAERFMSAYYGLIDAVCIALLVVGAIAIAKPRLTIDRVAVALGTLAIASICTTLGNGNFGLIVTTAVMLSIWFDQRGKPIPSGIFFWIALMKPTISMPFAVIFLLERRWKPMLLAGILCTFSCLLPWLVDHVDPIEMTKEAIIASRHFQFGGYGMVNWLSQLGVSNTMVTPVAAVLVIVPAAIFFLFNRTLPIWKNLAILAVIGRFWGYHMAHDNIMLFFLSCAVWKVFFADSNIKNTILLVAIGGSLWLPSSLTEHEWIGIVQHIIWLGAVIYLVGVKIGMTDEPIVLFRQTADGLAT